MRDAIVGLINPLIALIFAGVFFAIWMRDRNARHVLGFAGAYALLSVGFLWSQFSPTEGSRYWLMLTNIPYFFGTVLLIHSAAARVGRRLPMGLVWSTGVFLAGLLLVGLMFPYNAQVELYVSNTAMGLLFLLGAQAISARRSDNIADALVFWLLVITSTQFLTRPSISFMIEASLSAETYRESIYYSTLNMVIALNSVGLALALIAAVAIDTLRAERESYARDPLSGLLTRGMFEHSVRAAMQRAEDKGVPLAMVVGDIDHFKKINDIWGHIAGDHAIAEFGKLIGRMVRDTDIAGRVGGEEFCVLVWNCEEGGAAGLAERLRKRTEAIRIKDQAALDVRLTASFGIAEQLRGEDYRALFARADAALYAAKKNGRNMVLTASSAVQTEAPDNQDARDTPKAKERAA